MIGVTKKVVLKAQRGQFEKIEDLITVEEPLELVVWSYRDKIRTPHALSVTMRTPGEEENWAVGFLITEGVIYSYDEIDKIDLEYGIHKGWPERVHVYLKSTSSFSPDKFVRHFYANSSCGVCGKSSIDQVTRTISYILKPQLPLISSSLLKVLPQKLDRVQSLFNKTGSIHATALFDSNGNLLRMCEDVGRHNAMDKLIGYAIQSHLIPLSDKLALVSGRASFELVQKALVAGIPILAAIGAPSSLAIELAEAHNMTLIGFLSASGMNVYTGQQRIIFPA